MPLQHPRRHLGALLFMLLGSGLVFGGVLAMNLFSEPPKRDNGLQETSFEVEKKPPPPRPKRERRSQPKRQMKSVARAPAPVPEISSQLSGVSFGLPQFNTDFASSATDSVLGDTTKSTVMTEDTVDKKPQVVRPEPPAYPSSARKRGIEGSVTMTLLVNPDGRVSGIRVLSADPPGVFEEAAKEALAHWEFRPAEYQGTPVTMRVKQTITFKLQ